MTVLRNAKILTMADPPEIGRGSIAIENGRIADIQDGPGRALDDLDLKGMTVMPGLVNSHIHFTMWRSRGSIREHRDTATQAFRAVRAGINCLRKGITAAREMGHRDSVHLQLRDAVDSGLIEGPRIFSAGNAIVMTHGHAHFICEPVDGTEGMVAAIRRQVSEGCDFIKIIASNDDLWRLRRDQFPVPWFSASDLRIAAETAHGIGIPVTAHANGIETINRVIDAGFDSLEHGIYMDDDAAARMASRRMCYIPTMTGYRQNSDPSWGRGPEWTRRYAALWEVHLGSVKNAVRKKVTIAAGTDTLGDMAEEMELLVLAGLSPAEALAAATINGARLIGMDDRIGTVEVGKAADLIVLDGDPTEDVTKVRNIRLVIKNGKILKPETLGLMLPDSPAFATGW